MQPADVIADPELTVGLSAALTAYTGVDAYVHCFEAFCAQGYHPMADGIALEGMRLIKDYLPRAVARGTDIEARTHMILASSMGATAFQKGLGVVHAIAHALGGKLNAHHGLLNAILLPYCMAFNRSAIEEKSVTLARHFGLDAPSFSGLLSWTLDFRTQLGIPHTLEAIPGMSVEKAKELAPLAFGDAALGGNPRPSTVIDLEQIMINALAGRLSM
jgi:alcohol dehydrogenase class IV